MNEHILTAAQLDEAEQLANSETMIAPQIARLLVHSLRMARSMILLLIRLDNAETLRAIGERGAYFCNGVACCGEILAALGEQP